MADIAQSDAIELFFRRIGYTVGLEQPLERLCLITSRYVKDRQLTPKLWDVLVGEIGLKGESSSKHLLNFYSALGFLISVNGRLLSQLPLDVLSAIWQKTGSSEHRLKAANFVLLYSLVLRDGDVFLNALESGFKRENVELRFRDLVLSKREALFRFYKNAFVQEKLKRVISIETQPTNRGSLGVIKARVPAKAAPQRDLDVIDFTDDWQRHVISRRRTWSTSLDLWAEDSLTGLGASLVATVRSFMLDFFPSPSVVSLLPTDLELMSAKVTVPYDPKYTPVHSDFVASLARPYIPGAADTLYEPDQELEFLRELLQFLRLADRRKASLVKEIPLLAFQLYSICLSIAQGKQPPDISSFVSRHRSSESGDVQLRSSRQSNYGIVVR